MIQLVAVDMDGTLLNPSGKITEKTVQTILKLQNTGIEFVICTGRSYMEAKEIVEESGIICSYICLSGAAIYDSVGKSLLNIPMDNEQVLNLADIFKSHKLEMDIMTADGQYTTSRRKAKLADFCQFLSNGPLIGCPPEQIKELALQRLERTYFIKDISQILNDGISVYKICGNQLLPPIVSKLKEEFAAYPQFSAASSFPTNIEITDVKAQKGFALKTFADLHLIPMDQVMAIGDSDNDLSMLSMDFGYTVAMANAMDCIKNAAKYHTKSNQEDGVAWAIGHYILGKN